MNGIMQRTLETERKRASEEIRKRVQGAIELLLEQGRTPSFYAVAETAHVARSTLYRREDLRELVVKARANSSPKVECPAATSEMQVGELLKEADHLVKRLNQLRSELSRLSTECDILMGAATATAINAKTIASVQDSRVEYACCSIPERLAA